MAAVWRLVGRRSRAEKRQARAWPERILAAAGVLTVVALLAAGCGSGSHSRRSAVDPREHAAWNELSSALADLTGADLDAKDSLDFAQQIGADGAASVDWNTYQSIAKRLRRWQRRRLGIAKPYWQDLARAGTAVSDAMVSYASDGEEIHLVDADAARRDMHAILKEHCSRATSDVILTCK